MAKLLCVIFTSFAFLSPLISVAQETKTITLNDAISLGLTNSKTLKLSKSKVDKAISVYNQTLDKALPSAKASAIYNHAEIPNNVLQLGPGDPVRLPKRADAFIGTLSIQELIFAGNKLKYAKESTDLLKKITELDVDKSKQDVSLAIINSYLNLYKLDHSKEVINQNIAAIDTQLKQTNRFFDQGLVTKNDVLRLQLQRSNIELTGLDLDKNRNIVNYNLDILLGLQENTIIKTAPFNIADNQKMGFVDYLDSAMLNRVEIKQMDFRAGVNDRNIASIKADKLPTLGAGVSAYYLNPKGFIPNQNEFITPLTIGATLSWNISNLFTTKNKVAEATIDKNETLINKNILMDNIKLDVNRNYETYLQSLKRIDVISASIAQAQENDKIVTSKYQNNIASITDRIDADTQLFQAKINLEIAKADAQIAYYNLLRSAGIELNR
ncbi:TolC family protein [Pedobacter sp. SD-b]|uniref:TolC family protein n=2 Tax=Pedobacter segetis TaxID=2793069 RepID=A0ABS1BK43_9SPHI|nr:TolC family protein [Pedobacter segetis]